MISLIAGFIAIFLSFLPPHSMLELSQGGIAYLSLFQLLSGILLIILGIIEMVKDKH